MSANVKVLDCTFRDGGYYNKWDFDSALVHKYLYATENAKIDVIELGFRNLPQNIFLGAFAYTTDIYINTLKINDEAVVGVMIDANSIMNSELSINDVISGRNFCFLNPPLCHTPNLVSPETAFSGLVAVPVPPCK